MAFSIAQLRAFLQRHELKVNDGEEELIGDETEVIRLRKIDDEYGSKVNLYLFSLLHSSDTRMLSKIVNSKRVWR